MDERERKKEERRRNNRKMISKVFILLGASLALYTIYSLIRGTLSGMYIILMSGVALVFVGLGLLSGTDENENRS